MMWTIWSEILTPLIHQWVIATELWHETVFDRSITEICTAAYSLMMRGLSNDLLDCCRHPYFLDSSKRQELILAVWNELCEKRVETYVHLYTDLSRDDLYPQARGWMAHIKDGVLHKVHNIGESIHAHLLRYTCLQIGCQTWMEIF